MNSKRFGIDLGTTFSSIAQYDPETGRVEVIPDEDTSQNTVPSAVYFAGGDQVIVGGAALNMAPQAPSNLCQWIKMSMGEEYNGPFNGKEYTAEQISAEILKHLKKNAELYTGEEVSEVVVTVPAYFGDRERMATAEAVQLAGMKLIRLLPEPSAAALAHAIDNIDEVAGKNVLVYDLGGGTFDVTLMQTQKIEDEEGRFSLDIRVIVKDGSRELGGKLWDDRLIEYVARECDTHFGFDPRLDDRARLSLNEKVIQAKHQLSKVEETDILVDTEGNTVKVTREGFRDLTQDLLMQTEEKVNNVLEKAAENNIAKDEIDIILLAGGATRMPAVKQLLLEIFGREPKIHKNLDLVVSIGAAYDAQIASGDLVTKDKTGTKITIAGGTATTDVGKAIGVTVAMPDGDQVVDKNHIVIPEGSPTGEEFANDGFATVEDGQMEIEFHINEGESENMEECSPLGSAVITGLPPDRPKGRPLKVILKYNANGIIEGRGIDLETGLETEIRIDRRKISSGV
ncbi:MAG: Hsp70 family protein [bacterium]|nr:Hsp70 family protein [bacterium]